MNRKRQKKCREGEKEKMITWDIRLKMHSSKIIGFIHFLSLDISLWKKIAFKMKIHISEVNIIFWQEQATQKQHRDITRNTCRTRQCFLQCRHGLCARTRPAFPDHLWDHFCGILEKSYTCWHAYLCIFTAGSKLWEGKNLN